MGCMKGRLLWVILFVLLLNLMTVQHVNRGAAQVPATIYVDPPETIDSSMGIGSTFKVDINILNADNLYGWQANITFNREVVNVTTRSAIVQGSFLKEWFIYTIFTRSINYDAGYLLVQCSDDVPYDEQGVSGDGWLASITFTVIAAERGTLLQFGENTKLKTLVGETLVDIENFTTEDGIFDNRPAGLNTPPVANFYVLPPSGRIGEVSFDASASYDTDAWLISYHWDYGDTSTDLYMRQRLRNVNLTATTTHTYTQNGTYTVTLTVKDSDNATATATTNIKVGEKISTPPMASFTWTPELAIVADLVTFDASASQDSDGFIISYSWNFGDGNTMTVTTTTIQHAYLTMGTYPVTLTVTDNDTLTNSLTKPISIKLRGTISLTVAPPTIIFGDTTTINGLISPAREGVNVTISYRLQGETEWKMLNWTLTDNEGKYSYAWTPPQVATYEIKTSCLGDASTTPADSSVTSLTVNKMTSTITLNIEPTTVTVDSDVYIDGTITPTRANINVTIHYRRSGDEAWTDLATVKTNSNSDYTHIWKPTKTGTYQIKASWQGDANTQPSESDVQSVKVQEAGALGLVQYAAIAAALLIIIGAVVYFTKVRGK